MATAPPPEPSLGKSLLSEIENAAPPPSAPPHVYEHRYEVRLRGQTYAEVVEDHEATDYILNRAPVLAFGRRLLRFSDNTLVDPTEIVLFREVTPEEALDIQEEAEKAEAVFDGVEALRRALEALPPRQAATAAHAPAAPATPANGSGL